MEELGHYCFFWLLEQLSPVTSLQLGRPKAIRCAGAEEEAEAIIALLCRALGCAWSHCHLCFCLIRFLFRAFFFPLKSKEGSEVPAHVANGTSLKPMSW